jgi:uncharacterized membrane protein
VTGIEVDPLVRIASSYNALLIIDYAVGDVISDASPVIQVYEARGTIPPSLLRAHIALDTDQTIEENPKYAIRLLVDIAIKALSPAVNDPTTAVQALNQIDDLLRRIGTRQLDVGYVRDRRGALRVIYPTAKWEDFLSLGIDEIRIYGANSLQVMRRLGALLEDLESIVPEERRPAVRLQQERVQASIRRTFADRHDRLEAEQVDRQGIGMSREPEDEIPSAAQRN